MMNFFSKPDRRSVSILIPLVATIGLMLVSCKSEKDPSMDAIYSGVAWYDQNGDPVSAHGAGIYREGDTFYLFGEYKQDGGNGFSGISCYSSKDLCNWTFERVVLPVQESGRLSEGSVGERPKVMKCPNTGQYVMYLHTDDSRYKDPAVGYATSNTVNGVYTYQGLVEQDGNRIRKWDMGVFQDDDGTGYLVTHSGYLYRLNDDYTEVEETVVEKMTPKCESPVIFKREGLYYWLGSGLTSWERNDNYYFTATDLKGPWQERGFIAPEGTLTWNSQCTFLLPIAGTETTTYLYMGDRWAHPYQQSAATYVWQPLAFNESSILLPEYYQGWRVNVETGAWERAELDGEWIDDSDLERIHYSEGWETGKSSDGDGFDDHRSDEENSSFSIEFKGTQIGLCGVGRPDGGFSRVEIFDDQGGLVLSNIMETYCAYPESSLKFLSPVLDDGTYQLKVTVMREHFFWKAKTRDFGSSGYYVSLDKVLIRQ